MEHLADEGRDRWESMEPPDGEGEPDGPHGPDLPPRDYSSPSMPPPTPRSPLQPTPGPHQPHRKAILGAIGSGGIPRVIDKFKYFNMIGHIPHSRQWLFHKATQRFRIAVCGRRWGKSFVAGRDIQPKLLLPNKRYWIVGPTYDLSEKEFRVIWNDMIVGLTLGRDRRVRKAYNKRAGEMFIEFPWQTRIECRSADHPENLVGEKLDGVIMSEAAKHKRETWERYIQPALADRRGFADFPTTPEGFNWLYDLWQFGQNPSIDYKDYVSWRFPSWENPYVYPEGRTDEEVLRIEKTSIKDWFLQEIAAEFTAFVGKIYPEWDETVHVKQIKYNPNWKNYIAFDWGFVNPLAAIEFQVAPDDTVYVWREHYRSKLRLHEHFELLKNREQPPHYKIDLCFGDAADPEAILDTCVHFAPCLGDPMSKSNWRDGVELVKSFLALQPTGIIDEYGTPLNTPQLYVDHSCVNLIKEFNNYRAPEISGSTRTPRNPREDAQKYEDHALDALRYGLMHIFKLGARHSLHEAMEDIFISAQASANTDADSLSPSDYQESRDYQDYYDHNHNRIGASFDIHNNSAATNIDSPLQLPGGGFFSTSNGGLDF